jgi:hypothetical protein
MCALVLRQLISTFGWALTQTVGRRRFPEDVRIQSQSSSLRVGLTVGNCGTRARSISTASV